MVTSNASDAAVMAFALKFVNSAPKEKLIAELDVSDTIATKIVDQRDFGGYKTLDDICEKKLLRKKKFVVFRDRLLAYSRDNNPSDKPTLGEDGDEMTTSKKGKKKGAAGSTSISSKDGAAAPPKKHSFVETEPLTLRFGYLIQRVDPPADVVHDPASAEAY
ncbi:hypothetical protein H310_08234 [Aphanomyces invadans]|uniref:Uncharacterized protein n=1 Tax=Aphanomyces invadans TaxID=157072 RepID=A0A024TZZ0_9STRA|nr:hypothetical protein H310_08234 [Aphanomyces invadans]ETV99578.1 hypothetical protein H310_08234 [Aphanomyces invadans]RHY33353.1 hypothetical protein DYB32_001684 [Aphanomyces invadans]|eukprot:XP_008872134.1 hypothetical protein H310_08234 [Aphanomyces invadans]